MAQCDICKTDLGFFKKKYACKDGYVCDDCFYKSKVDKARSELTISEIKRCLFSKKRTEERARRNMDFSHTQKSIKLSNTQKFCPTISFCGLLVDENLHKFTFDNSIYKYEYYQLVSYNLVESTSEKTTTNGGVGRAIVGGVIAGGVGAIVGATTAKSQSDVIVNDMYISIITSPNAVTHTISLIKLSCTKSSAVYSDAMYKAQKIIGILDMIKSYQKSMAADIKPQPATAEPTVASQIKQFKELLDIGAITQEEYDAKKEQLLGL